ncbi:cytidine deaminase [bacterium]|nr:cytidine deaminase [bacterium]
MKNEELIKEAIRARENAIATYSDFRVGSVVVTRSGKVFTGCNVENSTYGLTMCAERVAIFKALSEGEREFTKIAVAADTPQPCYPCGACRQIIWDFAPDAEIICANLHGQIEVFRAGDLIPHAFGANNLDHKKEVNHE